MGNATKALLGLLLLIIALTVLFSVSVNVWWLAVFHLVVALLLLYEAVTGKLISVRTPVVRSQD